MNTTFTCNLSILLSRFCLATAFLFTAGAANAQTMYALSGNNLITFSPTSPGTVTFVGPLTGIATGQVVEGMDFRPATGQLYALGYIASSGVAQVYSINLKNAVTTAVGSSITLATSMSNIGFDFNPMADRIRVTSSSGINYRLNPITGDIVATDINLNYVAGDPHAGSTPTVVAVGYTNSFAGTGSTTMYVYDYSFNSLASSSNPNAGSLSTVGNAGVTPVGSDGLDMDIAYNAVTGINLAYLTARVNASSNNFYTIDLTTGAATLVGAIGGGNTVSEMAVYLPPPTSKLVYGLSGTSLISFNSSAPGTILSNLALTGITTGQTIEGMDFRPATGQLFALGYVATSGQAQVYTINPATGVATTVIPAITLAANMQNVSFDFNPMADRIRITSSNRQNYRLNPNDGSIVTDGALNYAAGDPRAGSLPAVITVAYANSFSGTTTTTMFGYDSAFNSLTSSSNPNAGALNTVGTSGITPAGFSNFDMDISTNTTTGANTAYLATASGTSSNLYVINIGSGNAGLVGTIGSSLPVSDIAIYIPPVPPNRLVYAVSAGNLISFNTTTPGTVAYIGMVPFFPNGQALQGLDFRPATGGLYALGYNSISGQTQIYTVNTTNAAVTPVGPAITLPAGMTNIGFDFNPMVDRIRVTSGTGQNYRLNPNDGTLAATDGSLNYATGDANAGTSPNIAAVSYTNNVPAAAATTLYYYDYRLDVLATTSSPNTGTLNTVGNTGILSRIISVDDGLDIDVVTDNAGVNTIFLAARTENNGNLYTVDPATGEVRIVGTIAAAGRINRMAISVPTPPLPVSITNFFGKKLGNSSELSWTTQSESNNSHFVIERSFDGKNFSAASDRINSLAPDGNSSQPLDYAFTDVSPVKGINYYRLLQVDKDGKKSISKTVQLRFDGGSNISLYPNPTIRFINVNGNLTERTDLQIRLSDISGKIIRTTVLKGQNGNWSIQLRADHLPAGIYYITVIKDNTIIYTEAVQKL